MNKKETCNERHKTSFIAASCLSSSPCGIALISHQVMALCFFSDRCNVLDTTTILTANFCFQWHFLHLRLLPLLPTAAVGSECDSPTASKAGTRCVTNQVTFFFFYDFFSLHFYWIKPVLTGSAPKFYLDF